MNDEQIQEVVPEMRDRLKVNRFGKMTGSQWVDIVTAPLVTLMLLIAPAAVLFSTRLIFLTARGLWLVGIVVLIVVLITIISRAYRYARAPVQFATLHARGFSQPFWRIWRPLVMYTEDGEEIVFKRRLAPPLTIVAGRAYIVYYLHEPHENVLLSIAPADHPDVTYWQPTSTFKLSLNKRSNRP